MSLFIHLVLPWGLVTIVLPLSWLSDVSQLFTCSRWSSPLWTSSFTLKLFCPLSTIWPAPCHHDWPPSKTKMSKSRWRRWGRAGQVSPDQHRSVRTVSRSVSDRELFPLQCLKEPKMATSSVSNCLLCWVVSTWRCVTTVAGLPTSESKVRIRLFSLWTENQVSVHQLFVL